MDLETLPHDVREKLFRLSERNSVIKWAIGTVGLTLVTSIAGWHFQNREVRLEEVRFEHERKIRELEFEQKYLGEFLEFALVEDLDSRVRFAHYFASVSTNDILAAKWEAYHADLIESAPLSTETQDDSPVLAAATRIGGVEALAGRKITRIWLGAEPVASMEEFQSYHVDELGWADIGFHYYVNLEGSVQNARPVTRTPAFVLNHNTGAIAIGIACAGWTGTSTEPPTDHVCEITPAQKETLASFSGQLLADYDLNPGTIGKRSDFRPVPDLLGRFVTELQGDLAKSTAVFK